MSCCVVVFIADYNYLERCYKSSKTSEEYHFYEKFFNYRIDLTGTSIDEAMTKLCAKKHWLNDAFRYNGYCTPPEAYLDLRKRLGERDGKEEADEEKNRAEYLHTAALERLEFLLENPRRMIKVLTTLEGYYSKVNRVFQKGAQENRSAGRVKQYFKLIRLHETLFLLAFINACFPPEAKELSQKGCEDYFNRCMERANDDENAGCICGLADGLFFRMIDIKNNTALLIEYEKQKVIYFADTLLKNPEELPTLVNTFSQQEEEWLAVIDRKERGTWDKNWNALVQTVLTRPYLLTLKNAERELQKGRERMKTLLAYAAERIREKPESTSRYLSFLSFRQQQYRWMDSELPFMKELYEALCAEDITGYLPVDFGKWLDEASGLLVHQRMQALTAPVLLFEGADPAARHQDESIVENAVDQLFVGTKADLTEKRLNYYIGRVSKLTNFPAGMPLGVDAFTKLNWLLDRVEDLMRRYDMLQYEDGRLMLARGRAAVEDMWYFELLRQIAAKDQGWVDLVKLQGLTEESVDDAIKTMWILWEKGERPLFDQTISTFFQWLYDHPGLLDEHQTQSLQKLITKYCDSGYQNAAYYRRVLLNCTRRREQGNEESGDKSETAEGAALAFEGK